MATNLKVVLLYTVGVAGLVGATTLFRIDENSEIAANFALTATPTAAPTPSPTPTRVRLESGPKGCITTPWGGLDGYQAGAPFRTRLSPPDESQPRLIVSGHVYAADCLTPLAGALLEVWQANGEGRYDAAHFAARLVTDSEGRYEFSTVQPSPYFTSNQFFPAHIHYRVSYPAAPTVATQIFFEGDPLLKMQRISSAQRRLIRPIQLGRGPAGPVRRVTFDISLAIAPPG